MISISKATNKESLKNEWRALDIPHYGKSINWIEKDFRFKAVEDGQLLGTIDGKIEADVIYIGNLLIKESSRGIGIGTMLIKKAEEFGKKYKAHKTWLVTGEDWSSNTFYKKLGFKAAGSLPDFFFHKNFVIYTRSIK